MKATALIVDDEELARIYLRSCLADYCPEVQVLAEASNVREAISQILKTEPDIVFIDVEMPGGNGFEILKAVPQAKMPRFVFVTAHNKYAIEALRAGALDYLLKPVDQSALQVTCSKLLLEIQDATLNTFSLEELDASIPLTHQSGFLLVRLGDVVHLEADNNYTMIFLNEGHPQTSTQNLGKYEKILPPNWFFRVHRSHLINLHHLKAYTTREGGFVMMSDGAKLPVSRLRIPELLHQVSLLGMGKTNRK